MRATGARKLKHSAKYAAGWPTSLTKQLLPMIRGLEYESKGIRSLRRGRYSESHRIYHITAVTKDRERPFSDFWSGRIVVEALKQQSAAGNCYTLCFVVMPDHLHWLMQLSATAELSNCVAGVKSRSARRVNLLQRKRGRLWQKGFHDHAMRRDEDVAVTARYIVANPVRAGLVERVGDYPLWDAIWV